jgi:hypothetical protein
LYRSCLEKQGQSVRIIACCSRIRYAYGHGKRRNHTFLKGEIMDGNIETAAKKFGVFLIVATIIFVIGLHMTLKANMGRLGRNVEEAGRNARPAARGYPNNFSLKLFPQGTFRVDLGQDGGRQLRIAPLKVELEDKTGE